jgi:hypothetical protein
MSDPDHPTGARMPDRSLVEVSDQGVVRVVCVVPEPG